MTRDAGTIARADAGAPFDAAVVTAEASSLERPKPAASPGGKLSCRLIGKADLSGVTDVLCAGFPRRTRAYWTNGLARLARLVPPDDLPQFGWLLEASGRPVGVHLLISSRPPDDPAAGIRSNVSSWYVDEDFRLYGTLLTRRATGKRTVTYVNISPDLSTLPIIEAQGFKKVSQGAFAAFPLLARHRDPRVRILSSTGEWAACSIPPQDFRLLADHEAFGCFSVWCRTQSGGQPLIFRQRWISPGVPCAQLIYCRSLEYLEEVAGPIGRFLALRGMPIVLIATPRPLRGVPGRFFSEKFSIYSKGALAPRAGDLSYTEAALFGM